MCDENRVKIPLLVSQIWCSQGCFRDAQTHSRTDTPENRIPPVPNVFGGGGIESSQVSDVAAVQQSIHLATSATDRQTPAVCMDESIDFI